MAEFRNEQWYILIEAINKIHDAGKSCYIVQQSAAKESINMFEDILSGIKDSNTNLNEREIIALNPLVLAYVGDAVYEVYIRTFMVNSEPNKTVHKLHLMSTDYVRAHAQSDIVHKITSILTEEELSIIKRGRNSKSGYVPKNADVIEYRTATGFEALIGYLYLTGNTARLIEILNYSMKKRLDSE